MGDFFFWGHSVLWNDKAGITGTDTTYDDGVRMKPGQSVLDIDTGQTCACTPVVLGGYSVHVNG